MSLHKWQLLKCPWGLPEICNVKMGSQAINGREWLRYDDCKKTNANLLYFGMWKVRWGSSPTDQSCTVILCTVHGEQSTCSADTKTQQKILLWKKKSSREIICRLLCNGERDLNSHWPQYNTIVLHVLQNKNIAQSHLSWQLSRLFLLSWRMERTHLLAQN